MPPFIGQKFRKKITPTPALYPSYKNTDSGLHVWHIIKSCCFFLYVQLKRKTFLPFKEKKRMLTCMLLSRVVLFVLNKGLVALTRFPFSTSRIYLGQTFIMARNKRNQIEKKTLISLFNSLYFVSRAISLLGMKI